MANKHDQNDDGASRPDGGRPIAAKMEGDGRSVGSASAEARGSNGGGPGATPASGKGRRGDPAEWLGRGLRRLYQDTVSEPIPDKFRALLDQLDQQGPADRDTAEKPKGRS